MKKSILNMNEVCKALGIGRTKAYKMVQNKTIPSGRIGKKIVVKANDLEKYITSVIREG